MEFCHICLNQNDKLKWIGKTHIKKPTLQQIKKLRKLIKDDSYIKKYGFYVCKDCARKNKLK